jgi:hypothetical protein
VLGGHVLGGHVLKGHGFSRATKLQIRLGPRRDQLPQLANLGSRSCPKFPCPFPNLEAEPPTDCFLLDHTPLLMITSTCTNYL